MSAPTYAEGLLELEDATDCAGAAREDHEMVSVSVGAINAVLDRLEALASREREGWVLVPREPTEDMLVAAGATPAGVMPRGGVDRTRRMLPRWWTAMLSAAPKP